MIDQNSIRVLGVEPLWSWSVVVGFLCLSGRERDGRRATGRVSCCRVAVTQACPVVDRDTVAEVAFSSNRSFVAEGESRCAWEPLDAGRSGRCGGVASILGRGGKLERQPNLGDLGFVMKAADASTAHQLGKYD